MISLIHHGDSSWAIHLNDFEDSCWVYVFKAVSVLKIENVCACFIELNAHENRSLCLWIFLGSSLTMKASNSKGSKNIAVSDRQLPSSSDRVPVPCRDEFTHWHSKRWGECRALSGGGTRIMFIKSVVDGHWQQWFNVWFIMRLSYFHDSLLWVRCHKFRQTVMKSKIMAIFNVSKGQRSMWMWRATLRCKNLQYFGLVFAVGFNDI